MKSIKEKISESRIEITKYQIMKIVFFIVFTSLASAFFRTWRVNHYGIEDMIYLSDVVSMTLRNPWPSYHKADLIKACMVSATLFLFTMVYRDSRKVTRHREEYGSARWGRRRDIRSRSAIDLRIQNTQEIITYWYLEAPDLVKRASF